MSINRIFDLLDHYRENFPQKTDMIAGKEDGDWRRYSINEVSDIVNNISYGFLKLGVKPGDKIATISPNRPEWNFLDLAILQIGAIHVPIYPTISESDYQYILNHAEVTYTFVSGMELLRKIQHILPDIPSLKGLYTMKHIDDVKHLNELIELGKANHDPEKLGKIKESIKAEAIATLIYTSGTTGTPKGVMLSHNNILSNVMGLQHIFPIDHTSKCISYLPLCHVYERTNIYVYMYKGTSVYYAENMGTIADNIREVKPEIFATVPRLLEKVYDKIMAKGRKLSGIKKQIFFWAVNVGNKYELKGKGPFYKFKLAIARKLVFSKWLEALGGNLRVVASGAAALQPRLSRIFTAAGVPILEGYGLTEASPVISVQTFDQGGKEFGTVGPPLKNLTVKIEKDGEICVKGPNVMIGYYKEPELTKEAISENGWLHTGDIGVVTESNHLKITGRKKEIFKTSMGKYISPALIENKFKESPFIDQLVVLGENQKFAAALVVPDFNHLKSYCKIKGIDCSEEKDIINNPDIKKRIHQEIEHYNKFFGDFEKIKKYELIDHEWSIETGELTASLKLRRQHIYAKYADVIEKIFS